MRYSPRIAKHIQVRPDHLDIQDEQFPTMHMIRAINVLTLACLLVLTGCFGLVDDGLSTPAEGTGSNAATVNNAPSITSSETLNMLFSTSDDSQPSYDSNDQLIAFTFSLYYAVIDIDGDNLTVGWDTNLSLIHI